MESEFLKYDKKKKKKKTATETGNSENTKLNGFQLFSLVKNLPHVSCKTRKHPTRL